MKKRTRKVLLMLCCALALVGVSIGATLAYLTDTETVQNTFTVGNVQIDLNETDVDNDGSTKGNDYHLVPGQTYVKDPTVTIKANSEPSYVRMFVTIQDYDDLFMICDHYGGSYVVNAPFYNNNSLVNLNALTTELSEDWECVNFNLNYPDSTYEFRYVGGEDGVTIKKTTDDTLSSLFTALKVPGCFTNDDLKVLSEGYFYSPYGRVSKTTPGIKPAFGMPFEITVRAEAIQAAGFADADAAWAAFDAQQAGN